jgi:hypothetical protein
MSRESRLTAGVLLIPMLAVVYGGASILSLLMGDPSYAQNRLARTSGEPVMLTGACCSSCP